MLLTSILTVLLLQVLADEDQVDRKDCNVQEVFCFDVMPDFNYSFGRYAGASINPESLLFRLQVYRDHEFPEYHIWHFDVEDPSLTGSTIMLCYVWQCIDSERAG